jgi:hypothetical protein
MAEVLIPAATLPIAGGPGVATPFNAAQGTALATYTGLNFVNNGAVVLVVNSTGTAATVTVLFQMTVEGAAITALSIALPATAGNYMIGPFAPSKHNDAAQLCHLGFTVVTGMTAGLYTLPGAVT